MSPLACRDVAAFLGDYVAGDLGPDERARFEDHLAVCPDCVAYLRQYAETIRAARDAYDDALLDEMPEELLRAILAARPR